ncbi:MAG: GerW family sporulation protein [Christensenellales bacterium]
METNITQYVDNLFANMENFTQKDGLIGKPVMQGDKTFMPVMSITLGYGGGDTHAKSSKQNTTALSSGMSGNMMTGALGIGAKLCTDAVIVIDKDNVMLASVSPQGTVSQMIDKIPQIIGKTQAQQSNQPPPQP